ncbi:hypothetical protein C8R43DRAFT_1128948 [Mycena crocata]|nr:hypothetical protein C8R43DRAFT_1128948 [Mycena crocata]
MRLLQLVPNFSNLDAQFILTRSQTAHKRYESVSATLLHPPPQSASINLSGRPTDSIRRAQADATPTLQRRCPFPSSSLPRRPSHPSGDDWVHPRSRAASEGVHHDAVASMDKGAETAVRAWRDWDSGGFMAEDASSIDSVAELLRLVVLRGRVKYVPACEDLNTSRRRLIYTEDKANPRYAPATGRSFEVRVNFIMYLTHHDDDGSHHMNNAI